MKLSSQKQSLELRAKTKLAELSLQLDKLLEEKLSEFESTEIDFVLENYSKFLTYDLKRSFESQREKNLKESPFDAIINDDLNLD